MPGWHVRTRELQESGRLQVVGIVQEQHPDRARLFMQWHAMDWPLLADPLDRLDVGAVPIVCLVDEHGVIRKIRPSMEDVEALLAEAPAGNDDDAGPPAIDAEALLEEQLLAAARRAARRSRRFVADVMHDFRPAALGQAIDLYRRHLDADPGDGRAWFRLGVAHRTRYDSDGREPDDFARAVDAWRRALAIDPGQYVWRRRLQQYGPRLDKPYSFYDWVREARADITARGDEPVALAVEPSGAEFAMPARETSFETAAAIEPDPTGRMPRDSEGFFELESAVVPHTDARRSAMRVHLVLRPGPAADWNNEAEPLECWLEPPPGWQISARRLVAPAPREITTREARHLEVELVPVEPDGEDGPGEGASPDASGPPILRGYVLADVCEKSSGRCIRLRKDLEIELPVAGEE